MKFASFMFLLCLIPGPVALANANLWQNAENKVTTRRHRLMAVDFDNEKSPEAHPVSHTSISDLSSPQIKRGRRQQRGRRGLQGDTSSESSESPSSIPSDAPSMVPSMAPSCGKGKGDDSADSNDSCGKSGKAGAKKSAAPSVSSMPSTSLNPSSPPSVSNMPSVSVYPSSLPSVSSEPSLSMEPTCYAPSKSASKKGSKSKARKSSCKGKGGKVKTKTLEEDNDEVVGDMSMDLFTSSIIEDASAASPVFAKPDYSSPSAIASSLSWKTIFMVSLMIQTFFY